MRQVQNDALLITVFKRNRANRLYAYTVKGELLDWFTWYVLGRATVAFFTLESPRTW